MSWTRRPMFGAVGVLLLAALVAGSALAQGILIDKPVRAGQLIAFPDANDAMSYYYVNDKPKLAMDANGKPQFSFLRYVENVKSGADQPEATEGEGGGIVHAVVALSISPEQVAEGQRELARTVPGAKLVGPVVYKSGKFGLVSSFKDTQGNLTKQVVGLGNAPLLDGEKVAVSIQLTKLGAKILWESFQTTTPDISFSFEMEVTGYRSPHRALIEANFDQVYEHKAFNAAIASTYLSAEIKTAFDDLQRTGAIKLTQVGTDEKLDALITTAYNKIAEMMFSPMGGTGTPDLASLSGGAGGQPGLLDRATAILKEQRADADAQNAKTSADNDKIRADNNTIAQKQATADANLTSAQAAQKKDENAAAAKAAKEAKDAKDASNAGDQDEVPAYEDGTPPPDADPPAADGAQPANPRAARQGLRPAANRDLQAKTKIAAAAKAAADASKPRNEKAEVSRPAFAVLASFEMKRVHQKGIFRIDLNKMTSDNMTLRFDENIGDLSKLTKDPNVFHQVNLDDPLYKQREVVVMVDGVNAKDFGEFVNFATVQLRRPGMTAPAEVRVDRNNFSKEGNAFKLMYGWTPTDTDRRGWMSYEYQTTWSFFGGKTVEGTWMKGNSGALTLAPPYQKHTIEVQGDPDAIATAGVRAVTVKLYYKVGDTEQVKQVTLNPAKGQLSEKLDLVLPGGSDEYDYEITWQLKGNKVVTSGRKHSSTAILFVDDVTAG